MDESKVSICFTVMPIVYGCISLAIPVLILIMLLLVYLRGRVKQQLDKSKLSKYDPVLIDLLSKDPHRIWRASCEIRKIHDISRLNDISKYLGLIEAETQDIDLGGAFHRNAEHLKLALLKLSYVKDKKGCLCELYPKDIWLNPLEEQERGKVTVI